MPYTMSITKGTTMKALLLYIAIGAISINVVANMASRTAEGMKAAREARIEKLCVVNDIYC